MSSLQTQVLNYEIRMYLIEMFTKDATIPTEKLVDEAFKRAMGVYGDEIEKDEIGWKKLLTKTINRSRFDYVMGKLHPKPFPKLQRHRCMFCSELWSYWWFANNNRVRRIIKNKGDICEYCQKLMTDECAFCFIKLEGVDWKIAETFRCPLCGQLNYRWDWCSKCINYRVF